MTMTDEELAEIGLLATNIVEQSWECSMCDGDSHPRAMAHSQAIRERRSLPNVTLRLARAIPALVAEVRRLRAEREGVVCIGGDGFWGRACARVQMQLNEATADRDSARAEVERLKAEVEVLRPGAIMTELRAGRFTMKCWSCGTDNEGMWSTCPVCGYERVKEVERP